MIFDYLFCFVTLVLNINTAKGDNSQESIVNELPTAVDDRCTLDIDLTEPTEILTKITEIQKQLQIRSTPEPYPVYEFGETELDLQNNLREDIVSNLKNLRSKMRNKVVVLRSSTSSCRRACCQAINKACRYFYCKDPAISDFERTCRRKCESSYDCDNYK